MDEIEENIVSDSDYNTLLDNIIKDKGGSRYDYNNLLKKIAIHESAGTMNPKLKQYNGGPGRGLYQIEGKKGSNRILTAAIRTKRAFRRYGSKVPEYINDIIKNGTGDASELTKEQQDILVLGDLRMKKGLDLKQYIKGDLKIQDLWADHWWAGSKNKRDERIKSFNNSIKYTDSNQQDTFKNIKTQNYNRNFEKIKDNTNINKQNNEFLNYQNDKYNYLNQTNNSIESEKKNIKPFSSDLSTYLNNYISNIDNNKLNEFNGGGTHEQNPNGGIPQGIGENGKINTVEEKETSFKLLDGKFIFSNRIKL